MEARFSVVAAASAQFSDAEIVTYAETLNRFLYVTASKAALLRVEPMSLTVDQATPLASALESLVASLEELVKVHCGDVAAPPPPPPPPPSRAPPSRRPDPESSDDELAVQRQVTRHWDSREFGGAVATPPTRPVPGALRPLPLEVLQGLHAGDPALQPFLRMLRVGVPFDAVAFKMAAAGVDPAFFTRNGPGPAGAAAVPAAAALLLP